MSLKQPLNGKSAKQNGPYTPVIFPLESDIPFSPSISSDVSSNRPKSFAYLAELSRKHEAFLKVMQEAPLCTPESQDDVDEESREQRINALRQRVREAWLKADGNPADSKWIFLTHLLRLSVTSGRNGRWIGVKPDIPVSEEVVVPEIGWINAKTDAEWKEWEKKYNQERRVKDKVENWQKKVVPASKRPSLQGSQGSSKATNRATGVSTSKTSLKVVAPPTDPLQNAAPLGFPVVKRLSQKNLTGKPSNSDKQPQRSDKTNDTNNLSGAKKNLDVTELSFHPPSFRSSQLATSTPKPPAKPPTSKPTKPNPISRNAPPSPTTPSVIPDSDKQQIPSSSPKVTRTYGRHNHSQSPSQNPLAVSASLPAIPIPSTPTRISNNTQGGDPAVEESFVNANNKRVISSPITPHDGDRALKKARTLPQSALLETSPSNPLQRIRAPPDQIFTGFPRTPKTPINNKRTGAASINVALAAAVAPVASTSSPLTSPPPTSSPKKQAVPTLLELLASAKKKNKYTSKPSTKGKAKEVLPQPSISEEQEVVIQHEPVDTEPTKISVATPATVPAPALPPAPASAPAPAPFMFPTVTALDDSVHANFNIPDNFAEAEKDPLLLLLNDPIADMSPTKSLSSLAGSDDDDDDDDPEDLGFSFHPLATSTQKGPFAGAGSNENGYFNAIATGSGSNGNGMSANRNSNDQLLHPGLSQQSKDSWESIYAPSGDRAAPPPPVIQPPSSPLTSNHHYVYNSQFNTGVAKNVDDVDRLLQQDVELAYSGWIRDPYADDDEQEGNPPSSSP